jgi:hypothetical protein
VGEGEIGYFRRNHSMPMPQVRDLAELNRRSRWTLTEIDIDLLQNESR